MSAELARIAKEQRRIQRTRRRRDGILDPLTDPRFGLDVESFDKLDPDAPIPVLLEAIEARLGELAALPSPFDPQHELRVFYSEFALDVVWSRYANPQVRGDSAHQWRFLLEMLEAAGEGTEGLHQHPERLKRRLRPLLVLTRQP
jgi:hypothetical protein